MPHEVVFGSEEVWRALEASVKLQSHYAVLLNMHDGGQRIGFPDAQAWLLRLRETDAEIAKFSSVKW